METRTYAKISAICSIVFVGIIVGILIFMLSMMFMFGNGPFDNQPIKEDSKEEIKIFADIQELSSVKTFKEINPDFRESNENQGHAIMYQIQARNNGTGNIYELGIQYSTYNQQFVESTSCHLTDLGVNNNLMQYPQMRHMNQKDLFLDATIMDSKCLDDTFYEQYPHLVQDKIE